MSEAVGARAGSILVDMSTALPGWARSVAEQAPGTLASIMGRGSPHNSV